MEMKSLARWLSLRFATPPNVPKENFWFEKKQHGVLVKARNQEWDIFLVVFKLFSSWVTQTISHMKGFLSLWFPMCSSENWRFWKFRGLFVVATFDLAKFARWPCCELLQFLAHCSAEIQAANLGGSVEFVHSFLQRNIMGFFKTGQPGFSPKRGENPSSEIRLFQSRWYFFNPLKKGLVDQSLNWLVAVTTLSLYIPG